MKPRILEIEPEERPPGRFKELERIEELEHRLVALAKKYAEEHDCALATVSRRFHGNDNFFQDFGKGKCSVTTRKMKEMIWRFRSGWIPPANVYVPKNKTTALGRIPSQKLNANRK